MLIEIVFLKLNSTLFQMNQKEKLMKVNELESNKIFFNHINAENIWKKL